MKWKPEHVERLHSMHAAGAPFSAIFETLQREYPKETSTLTLSAVKARYYKPASAPKSAEPTKKKQPPRSRSRRPFWSEEETELTFQLLSRKVPASEVVKTLKERFGTERTEPSLYQHLSALKRKLRRKGKTRSSKIARNSEASLVPLQPESQLVEAASTLQAHVSNGRAITIEFPQGQVRILPSGEIPVQALRGIAEAVMRAVLG